MMFHRQPSLPIEYELLQGLGEEPGLENEPTFDCNELTLDRDELGLDEAEADNSMFIEGMFIERMTHIQDDIKEAASSNISKAQSKQKQYYDSRHSTEVSFNINIMQCYSMH